jgi:hypothetical protein
MNGQERKGGTRAAPEPHPSHRHHGADSDGPQTAVGRRVRVQWACSAAVPCGSLTATASSATMDATLTAPTRTGHKPPSVDACGRALRAYLAAHSPLTQATRRLQAHSRRPPGACAHCSVAQLSSGCHGGRFKRYNGRRSHGTDADGLLGPPSQQPMNLRPSNQWTSVPATNEPPSQQPTHRRPLSPYTTAVSLPVTTTTPSITAVTILT